MAKLAVSEKQVIAAPPATVYTIISDYRTHHPQILPQPYFAGLDVESGGIGEGTIFRTTLVVAGRRFDYRMRVSEPERGRVIQETDYNSDLVTTFTIDPIGEGKSQVTITSSWTPRRGIQGLLERVFTPGLTRKIYRAELAKLDAYAAQL